MKNKLAEVTAITLLLLFAAALRITGISYGEPDMSLFPADFALNLLPIETPIHPDEFLYVSTPLQMRAKRTLNPEFLENPSFLINLNLVTYYLTGTGSDLVWDAIKHIGQRQIAPFALYVSARLYSALGGMLAVAAIYAASRVVAGRYAALYAGLMSAISLPLVQHAHYATTSSLAVGFSALAIWASLAALKYGNERLLLLSGVAAGLAASNRYNAGAVAIFPLAVGLLALRVKHKISRRTVVFSLIAVPAVFLFASPYIVRDFSRFLHDFQYIVSQYASVGQEGMPYTDYGLWYEYRYLIFVALGIAGSLMALWGAVVLWRRKPFTRLVLLLLLVFIIPYSLIVLRTVRPTGSDQLLVPVLPAFLICTGVGVDAMLRGVRNHRVAKIGISILLTVSPLIHTLPVVKGFSAPDTRMVMSAWMHEHLPEGAQIHVLGSYNVPLDSTRFTFTQTYSGSLVSLETLCLADYVVFSDSWANDMERSQELLTSAYLQEIRDYRVMLNTMLVEIARINRPHVTGDDFIMHTATIWHNPGLILYRVPASACAAAS